jgi:hypothetical protein
MINEKTTTHTPHHICGAAELRVIVRWLRSIDSRMISRLRSAVILLFSSIVVFVLRVLDFYKVTFALSSLLQQGRTVRCITGLRCKDK